jgi:hypothetical protein
MAPSKPRKPEAWKPRKPEAPEGGLVLSPEACTIKHYIAEIISKSQKARVFVTFSHPSHPNFLTFLGKDRGSEIPQGALLR